MIETPVRRERRQVIDRQSEESARRRIERFLPDSEAQRAYLSLLADTIIYTNRLGASLWGVTLRRDRIQMNVGRIRVLALYETHALLVVDVDSLDDRSRQALADRWNLTLRRDWYKSVSGTTGEIAFPPRDATDVILLAGEAHRHLIEKAARTARATPYEDSHSPNVVNFLRNFLQRDVPQPAYSRDIGGASGRQYSAQASHQIVEKLSRPVDCVSRCLSLAS